jgi:MoxR-like ATPase
MNTGEEYFVAPQRVMQAVDNLFITRNHKVPAMYVKYWLLLKIRGMAADGGAARIRTDIVESDVKRLLEVEHLTDYIEDDNSPYYDPFTANTNKGRKPDDIGAPRSIAQTTTGKFVENTIGSADPREWLSFRSEEGKNANKKTYYLTYTDDYYNHLGDGKDGFAPGEDARLEIPLLDLMAWHYRYESFAERLPYPELRAIFVEEFHLNETELSLVFIEPDDPETAMEDFYAPGTDKESIARHIAEKVEAPASELTDPDTREPLSQDERDVIVKSTLKTTYNTFDIDIDPRDDAIEAITEDEKHNLLMVGPPGTGKTYESLEIASDLGENTFFFQFHQSYSYEDFVESYEPVPAAGGGVEFEPVKKGFREACEAADEAEGYVFVLLDEINRANVSRVFGELFALIEYRESITNKGVEQRMLYSDEPLVIPDNLVIMATMNNLDKSTEDMEFALRRRFAQITFPPSTEALRGLLSGQVGPDELDELCLLLNTVIEDGGYPLGHTYFKDLESIDELTKLYRRRIRPSVQEYHGEYRQEQLEMIDDMFQQAARMELSETS